MKYWTALPATGPAKPSARYRFKLKELEVENAAHCERYTSLIERGELLQESLNVTQ